MVMLMGILFILGYVLISLEHKISINKGATALILSSLLWTLYVLASPYIVPHVDPEGLRLFLGENPSLMAESARMQIFDFVVNGQLLEHVGDVSEIVFFLLGAMTVVELIDSHNGFSLITDRIKTHSKRKLLWLLTWVAFFLSAVIDNMTTAIVMVALMSKLVPDKKERWWYASVIILAANGGGAWSPIGDVTTILLWVKGTITPIPLIKYIFLPSVVSVLLPLLWVTRKLKGEVLMEPSDAVEEKSKEELLANRYRLLILVLGIGGLLAVPVYKSVTHLPPFTGIMFVVGVLWLITDRLYRRIPDEIPFHLRVASLVKRIDIPTLLFFLGILLSVAALQASGGLLSVSKVLESEFQNVYVINLLLGFLSAVIDNVPLVAAALGLYPLVDPSTLQTMSDPTFMANFVPDGIYWHFLTYCAGIGGSMLIIGSAAGVVVMGMQKITFAWYLRNITWIALVGYLAGAAVYVLEVYLFRMI